MADVKILLIITFLITLVTFFPTTQAVYLYHSCGSNTTIFTPNSTYQSNLNNLLSILSSNSTSPSGFHNATAGKPPSETIYGLFLCRGDVTTSACKACVANVTSEAMQLCPVEKDVVIWYDDCMLRYSNKSFFSVESEDPGLFMWNLNNVTTEPAQFNQVLGDSMADVAKEASNDGDRFATKEAKFNGFVSLYSLGQCTQDLSSFDCYRCLKVAISNLPKCCGGKIGGRVLYPSCNIRYETYPFYQAETTPPPAPPPEPEVRPLSPPTTVTKGKVISINVLRDQMFLKFSLL